MQANLWAITSYFNPTGSWRRRSNYDVFRQRLNVPLVAVELAEDQPFELGPGDADILLQLRSPSVMWQKERLLNIALQHVPRQVSDIAWLDCDVVFANNAWAEEATSQLRLSALVQPFDHVFGIHAENAGHATMDRASAEPLGPTFVSRFQNNLISRDVILARGPSRSRRLLGFAWVARRGLLESHGFYDALIVGGGDRAMAMAAYGFFADPIDALGLHCASEAHYLQWAEPFNEAVAGRVGSIKGDLYHLWHGKLEDRKYVERHARLKALDFDPYADIALVESGAWTWATDKPELHAYVRSYFYSRREDG